MGENTLFPHFMKHKCNSRLFLQQTGYSLKYIKKWNQDLLDSWLGHMLCQTMKNLNISKVVLPLTGKAMYILPDYHVIHFLPVDMYLNYNWFKGRGSGFVKLSGKNWHLSEFFISQCLSLSNKFQNSNWRKQSLLTLTAFFVDTWPDRLANMYINQCILIDTDRNNWSLVSPSDEGIDF